MRLSGGGITCATTIANAKLSVKCRSYTGTSDDKLKLGVGEKVMPNTKRIIHSCMEFECSRVSKATAGSVYPWTSLNSPAPTIAQK